ncbi:hypothetical protein IU433_04245 [Nocardia puris]|uniref:DUF8176 domain-containing protein n=1 Tax=Nocardia puris TaxID=208602 RepID=A0A366DWI4_9NOCA|nr:hypothetical protein [Nocardia puris]MBF6209836.1 hypothetical protein [Nocardia puris]MBF6366408.1 hypothetical protein [Nocardia puris]MBF6458253.1 hypothetical protein [Nocardia puris]RBO94427.1 hypothetical protein DFR74_102850 [Nocardia puris]
MPRLAPDAARPAASTTEPGPVVTPDTPGLDHRSAHAARTARRTTADSPADFRPTRRYSTVSAAQTDTAVREPLVEASAARKRRPWSSGGSAEQPARVRDPLAELAAARAARTAEPGYGSSPGEPPTNRPEPEFQPTSFPEEDVFTRMIDRSPKRGRVRRWAPALIASIGALALTGGALTFIGSDDPAPTSSSAPAPAAEPAAAAPCAFERVGDRFQGNIEGGTDSGPSAIFAFQHAYYVTRSAELARAVVAPNASVPTAEAIQTGIDSIPAGTTHCVTITPGTFAGQFRVVVTEKRPDSAATTYNPQLVSVARTGDRTLITGIAPAS